MASERKQVHLLMPADLYAQVRQKADDNALTVTAYLLALVEADLSAAASSGLSLASLALRLRALEVHLGLDSRQPGQSLRYPAAVQARDGLSEWDGEDRRRPRS